MHQLKKTHNHIQQMDDLSRLEPEKSFQKKKNQFR